MDKNVGDMNDQYMKTFDAEEAAIIEFALLQSYKILKDYKDEWHQQQAEKIKQLLSRRFEASIDE
ncbi:hypothetical protein ACFO25_03825 [Paenactinomyces guangxiensis]|uniref:Uncharacterized protein n=1 Tax=Paenactinomyces guangxiensis TaxID=1490290 RepID=A0A7W1WRV5_9BACL|nr:hypothetical protein [Paenactinomyces guangxiensis]MBA4494895.1 hypothetical protein [Paenactinomyces guangxiensis]MBH8591978.1 hypothetical protein [Paenactinomyces guangxiensis]